MIDIADKIYAATGLTLRFENPSVPGTACNQDVVRLGGNPSPTPPAVTTYTVTLPAGIGLTSTLPAFSFDNLGRPNPNVGVTLTVVGGGAPAVILVERDTGYVR